jgi:hypothetical protein
MILLVHLNSYDTPLTNYITDSASSFNSASESGIKVVRGASFDKKEFKRNVAGSGAYAPTTTVEVCKRLVSVLQYFTSDLRTIVCIRTQCCPTQHARQSDS